eukprot:CAMPEP_0203669732 /NCGR_PEP_ID=MMETSP0090-20130426/6019_1 /ASSEMBLY_ACC=CAM_ASM_001088 /TAXON_ID=426623 /ORGANISM="Chaetoceros affinis, Strain CCMP159" /LENGTH=481 /DNA_ID=CAMNT_0050534469 /DNA_START=66 /DNA_END=1511 /DNA_ORIENTATION=-
MQQNINQNGDIHCGRRQPRVRKKYQQKKEQPQSIRLKCIVLGSAGAGKTSFLRRYFTGEFDNHRKSTIGADFYSTIMPNPWYKYNEIDSNQEEGDDDASTSLASKSKKSKKKKRKKKKKKSKEEREYSRQNNPNNSSPIPTSSSPPLSPATQSEYKQREKNLTFAEHVALQMWDTAGKGRFASESTGLTSRLGDSFFRFADAAILIYDATSSRSFLQLIEWYYELLERLRKINSENCDVYYDDNNNDDKNDEGGDRKINQKSIETNRDNDTNLSSYQAQNFPVLIVGTKLDRLKAELSKQARKKIVPQRDVLGLKGKSFKGKEYHYEYTVNNSSKHGGSEKTGGNTHDLETLRRGNVPLSYGLEKGRAWTSDDDYQDCLRIAEDECFPDRCMVLLWCKRNGLKHVEVSALDGVGVNIAVDTIVGLTLNSINEKMATHDDTSGKQCSKKQGGPIDFHERYKQDIDRCQCNCIFPWKESNLTK